MPFEKHEGVQVVRGVGGKSSSFSAATVDSGAENDENKQTQKETATSGKGPMWFVPQSMAYLAQRLAQQSSADGIKSPTKAKPSPPKRQKSSNSSSFNTKSVVSPKQNRELKKILRETDNGGDARSPPTGGRSWSLRRQKSNNNNNNNNNNNARGSENNSSSGNGGGGGNEETKRSRGSR